MLKIGYVRLRDVRSAEDTADLMAHGCQVVRAEETCFPGDPESETLDSILDFIGIGDQLVVNRLEHLGNSTLDILSALDRLDQREAELLIIRPQISSRGVGGDALRAALGAVRALDSAGVRRRPRSQPAEAEDIRALQATGMGPVEIARKLGVSRMTVWRKMKGVEA